jgi:hypothetical protein
MVKPPDSVGATVTMFTQCAKDHVMGLATVTSACLTEITFKKFLDIVTGHLADKHTNIQFMWICTGVGNQPRVYAMRVIL